MPKNWPDSETKKHQTDIIKCQTLSNNDIVSAFDKRKNNNTKMEATEKRGKVRVLICGNAGFREDDVIETRERRSGRFDVDSDDDSDDDFDDFDRERKHNENKKNETKI